MHATDSLNTARWPIAWLVLAAIGGVCCVALPPYLLEGAMTERWKVSMVCVFVLGLALGTAQPGRWLQLSGAAAALPAALLAIKIVYDLTRDATSHNLFPFEFLILGFICLPVWVGAFFGSLSRRLLRRFAG